MAKLAFKMAKPDGVKLAIKSIDDGAKLLNHPARSENPDLRHRQDTGRRRAVSPADRGNPPREYRRNP